MNWKRFKYLLLSPLWVATACTTGFKKSQCAIPPEEMGRCFADTNYRVEFYHKNFSTYCSQNGLPIDEQRFEKARAERLQVICGDVRMLFQHYFNTYHNDNAEPVCTPQLSNIPNVEEVNQDVSKAYRAHKARGQARASAAESQRRREKADQGFWSGILDRALQTSPEFWEKDEKKSDEIFQNIMAKYAAQGINEKMLIRAGPRLRCFGDESIF